MTALIMPQRTGSYTPPPEGEEEGHWETVQNPITGEVERVWIDGPIEDDPETPDVDESLGGAYIVECQANAIITGGLNSQGTTERWTTKGGYENVDFVEMRVGPDVKIGRRDRVKNITGPDGYMWREEDHPVVNEATGEITIPATVFQVRGVSPSMDIFNRVIEQFVLLERAENQEANPGG